MAAGADEDSVIKDELTLPIDWENSGRMSLLGNLVSGDEVLVEEQKSTKKTPNQPYSSMPDLSNSIIPGSRSSILSGAAGGSGDCASSRQRLTPSGNRPITLKEFEQQLNDLKKENFNLKLRIYYLENKLPKLDSHSGEDLLKKIINLQIEIETLKHELTRKDKVIQESTQNVTYLQRLHVHQLEECKREAEEAREKDRQELSKCNKLFTNLRDHYDDVSKNLMDLKAENCRLQELVVESANRQNGHLSESDADVSLLSDKERLILDLKTQLARLECQLTEQKQKYEDKIEQLEETLAKRPMSDAQIASVEMSVHKAQDQTMNKVSNFTGTFMHQSRDLDLNGTAALENTEFETCSILPLPADFDEKLVDMQKTLEEKTNNLRVLENTIQADRFELQQKVTELDCLKEELKRERENGIKRDKTIQGLMKTIDNERKLSRIQNKVENQSTDLAGVSTLTDPSLLGITNHFDDDDEDVDTDQYDDGCNNETFEIECLKDKLRQFERSRDSLYERIRRVAEFLLQLAEKLGGDAGKALFELSADLSKMKDNFDASTSAIEEDSASEFERLRNEISDKNDQLTTILISLNEKNGALTELAKSNAILQQKLEEALLTIKEKESAINAAFTEKCALDQNMQRLMELTETKDQLVSEISIKNSGLETELKTAYAVLKEKDNVIEELKSIDADLEAKLNAATEAAKTKDRMIEELSILEHQVKEFANACEEKQNAVDSLNRLNVSLEAKLEQATAIIKDKDGTISVAIMEKCDLEKNIQRLEEQIQKRSLVVDAVIQVDYERPSVDALEELSKKNEKLERYAKLVKSKYRQLETKIRQNLENEKNNVVVGGGQKATKSRRRFVVVDEELENMLTEEHMKTEDLESVVKQLEESNKFLAERLWEHEKTDDDLKQEAAKAKILSEKVRNYEKKLREKADRS